MSVWHDEAAAGRVALQRCEDCRHVQYPPRACCAACLSARIGWQVVDAAAGVLLARTVLHHSQEARFRPLLPLGVGLVQLDAGPVAVCFAPSPHAIGDRVLLRASLDAEGHPVLTAESGLSADDADERR